MGVGLAKVYKAWIRLVRAPVLDLMVGHYDPGPFQLHAGVNTYYLHMSWYIHQNGLLV